MSFLLAVFDVTEKEREERKVSVLCVFFSAILIQFQRQFDSTQSLLLRSAFSAMIL
jgi:hypothetical protein